MTNRIRKFDIGSNSEAVLDIKSTATCLGTSPATVRNWVKCGYLQTFDKKTKNLFRLSEIEKVKANITNGSLEKLNKRANKSKAERTFIPEEYLKDKNGFDELNKIVEFIKDADIDIFVGLLLISLNLLRKERILPKISIKDIIQERSLTFYNKQIGEEIISWLSEIKKDAIKGGYSFLLDCQIPDLRDVLGLIYQSLLLEGKKSQSGTYYTPSNIVNEITNEYVKKDSKVLDPCCGTGQFLLAFSDIVENPSNIYGVDIDKIAVRIARLNMLIKYKDKNFAPNIVCKDTLFDIGNYDLFSLDDENIRDFDVIATNPPWGIHFSKMDMVKLKRLYPGISSFESFSYFLKKSIDLLHDEGVLSFILPEAVLNVKTHKDIREILLNTAHIEKVIYLDRVFKNVFTPVIRLDLKKGKKDKGRTEICKEDSNYHIEQMRWKNNQDFVFDIHANNVDAEIITKIYNTPHATLEGKADWALGIVTGNNKKYIASELKDGFEEIYKGKDVERFILNKASSYINFTPEKFQQVAPVEKYRADEKLIYRFISKYLIFAYDNKQKLTLNSANIVIPKIPNYPIKVILALLNSSLYQFIFQKKFSSIKVLRNHIEQMPLPLWGQTVFNNIIEMVDSIIRFKPMFERLNNYIMEQYGLSTDEIKYIKEVNK